jgi:hypothetical protein
VLLQEVNEFHELQGLRDEHVVALEAERRGVCVSVKRDLIYEDKRPIKETY